MIVFITILATVFVMRNVIRYGMARESYSPKETGGSSVMRANNSTIDDAPYRTCVEPELILNNF